MNYTNSLARNNTNTMIDKHFNWVTRIHFYSFYSFSSPNAPIIQHTILTRQATIPTPEPMIENLGKH
jgi:hypothetical protein